MEKAPIAITWGMREVEQGHGGLLCISEELGQCFSSVKS